MYSRLSVLIFEISPRIKVDISYNNITLLLRYYINLGSLTSDEVSFGDPT